MKPYKSRTTEPKTGPGATVLLHESRFNDTRRRGQEPFDRLLTLIMVSGLATLGRDVLAKPVRSLEVLSNAHLTTSHNSDSHARQGGSRCRPKASTILSLQAMPAHDQPTQNWSDSQCNQSIPHTQRHTHTKTSGDQETTVKLEN